MIRSISDYRTDFRRVVDLAAEDLYVVFTK